MIYYKKDIGDTLRRTSHLSISEIGVYNLAMDRMFDTEQGIPHEDRYRILRAKTTQERKVVDKVLKEFFILEMQTWISLLVQQEIAKCRAKSEKCRDAVKTRYKATPKQDSEIPQERYERSTDVARTNNGRSTNILTKNLTKCSVDYKQDVIAPPAPDDQALATTAHQHDPLALDLIGLMNDLPATNGQGELLRPDLKGIDAALAYLRTLASDDKLLAMLATFRDSKTDAIQRRRCSSNQKPWMAILRNWAKNERFERFAEQPQSDGALAKAPMVGMYDPNGDPVAVAIDKVDECLNRGFTRERPKSQRSGGPRHRGPMAELLDKVLGQ